MFKVESFDVVKTSLGWTTSYFASEVKRWNFYSNMLSGILEFDDPTFTLADFITSKIENLILIFPLEGANSFV